MKLRVASAAALTLFCVSGLVTSRDAFAGLPFTCSNATLRGTYGTEFSGSGPIDDTPNVPLADVGFARLDGDGRLSGDDIIVVGGQAIAREFVGTYAVTRDCHASFVVQIVGDDGPPLVLGGVIVDGGNSVLLIQTSPAGTVSGRAERVPAHL